MLGEWWWHRARRVANKLMHIQHGNTTAEPRGANDGYAQDGRGETDGAGPRERSRSAAPSRGCNRAPAAVRTYAAAVPKAATVEERRAILENASVMAAVQGAEERTRP